MNNEIDLHSAAGESGSSERTQIQIECCHVETWASLLTLHCLSYFSLMK